MQVPASLPDTTYESVRAYYGTELESNADLKTSACCTEEDIPEHHKPILSLLPNEVLAKFYGCGSPIPPALDGCTVLDLGCGSGRDVFVAAALAGPSGRVIGVDMTEEQLDVAKQHQDGVAKTFGFDAPTTTFMLGTIENLAALGIQDESVDVVISNCVINLSPDKEAVFREVWRVLKPGGELYVSDVFADRRLSAEIQADPVLVGECLGGALYTEDFRRIMAAIGWADVRTVTESPIEVEDRTLADKLGNARFVSQTIRAIKAPDLIEDRCEDYGQVAYYEGGLDGMAHAFTLDDHHVFERGRPMLVCGNTAAMLEATRFAPYFRVVGDRSTHFGLFDCEPATDGAAEAASATGCC